MAKAKKKHSAKKSKVSKPRRIARQDALPGMEDAKIAAIETAALDYAEIRDQRQELTTRESDLKQKLLKLMHNEGKTDYKRNGISVSVVTESETVKVRVKAEIPEAIEDTETITESTGASAA